MMPSSRRPLLVFLRKGGGGVPGRWSFLTRPVEDPAEDTISSSLNGFSLRVFSGGTPLELDIIEAADGTFLKAI
jgi:hypothetical protein